MIDRYKVLILIGILFSYFLWIIGCGQSEQAVAKNSSDADAAQEKAIPVKVIEVSTEPLVESIQATGTIKPWHEADIMSQTSGQIEVLSMELGEFKKKDHVLAQVDDDLRRYAYKQAQAQHINAEANYKKSKRDLKRHQQLYEKKSITDFEMENARLQERSAYANLLSAEAALDIAGRQLEDTKIKAPIDGDIAKKVVDVGDTVSPGMPIATMIDIRKLRILVGLPSQEIPEVRKGQDVKVTIDAYPDQTFTGKVFFIGPQADLSSRTFPVEIVVQNTTDKKLKPGMIARVEIIMSKEDNVVIIPQESILDSKGKTIVYIVKGKRARKREIKVSRILENEMSACENLKTGELLVVTGQENLKEGVLVSVIK